MCLSNCANIYTLPKEYCFAIFASFRRRRASLGVINRVIQLSHDTTEPAKDDWLHELHLRSSLPHQSWDRPSGRKFMSLKGYSYKLLTYITLTSFSKFTEVYFSCQTYKRHPLSQIPTYKEYLTKVF